MATYEQGKNTILTKNQSLGWAGEREAPASGRQNRQDRQSRRSIEPLRRHRRARLHGRGRDGGRGQRADEKRLDHQRDRRRPSEQARRRRGRSHENGLTRTRST